LLTLLLDDVVAAAVVAAADLQKYDTNPLQMKVMIAATSSLVGIFQWPMEDTTNEYRWCLYMVTMMVPYYCCYFIVLFFSFFVRMNEVLIKEL
jgi:hypothetical protein